MDPSKLSENNQGLNPTAKQLTHFLAGTSRHFACVLVAVSVFVTERTLTPQLCLFPGCGRQTLCYFIHPSQDVPYPLKSNYRPGQGHQGFGGPTCRKQAPTPPTPRGLIPNSQVLFVGEEIETGVWEEMKPVLVFPSFSPPPAAAQGKGNSQMSSSGPGECLGLAASSCFQRLWERRESEQEDQVDGAWSPQHPAREWLVHDELLALWLSSTGCPARLLPHHSGACP